MLPVSDGLGKAPTEDEEKALRVACGASRSRALLPAVALALNTGMRRGEIQSLTWEEDRSTWRTGASPWATIETLMRDADGSCR